MSISDNVRKRMIEGSAIRRMFEEGNQLKERYGEENVFDFSIGNPVMEPPQLFFDELKRIALDQKQGMHRYMENAGYRETRQAVADQLTKEAGITFSFNDIVMTTGAAGAVNVIMKSILNPGEEVILFAPYFPEFDNYIDNHGGVPRIVPTNPDNFIPDLAALDKAIGPGTKAVIINSPNNPTGAVYDGKFIHQLGQLLEDKQKQYKSHIYLVSDEAYKKLVFDGIQYPPVFPHFRQTIVAASHSKDLALPGERIGYIAVHPQCGQHDELMAAFILCNRILGFVNAPAIMQMIVRKLQDVSISTEDYRRKRDFLHTNLVNLGYSVFKPQGTFYMFPKSPTHDELVFVNALKEQNILTVPGSNFGTPGYFRISFCIDDSIIERSIPGFEKVARDFKLI